MKNKRKKKSLLTKRRREGVSRVIGEEIKVFLSAPDVVTIELAAEEEGAGERAQLSFPLSLAEAVGLKLLGLVASTQTRSKVRLLKGNPASWMVHPNFDFGKTDDDVAFAIQIERLRPLILMLTFDEAQELIDALKEASNP
jgi:hypothetical protein